MRNSDPNDRSLAPGTEARDALAEVLKDQAERQERRGRTAPSRKTSQATLLIVAVVIGSAAVWLWLSPPAFIRPPPLAPTQAELGAGILMDLYVAGFAVDAHLERTGALPATLLDAVEHAEEAEEIEYQVLGPERYRLIGRRGGQSITYESTEPLSELAAAARALLEGGAP